MSGLDQIVNNCFEKLLVEYENFANRWQFVETKNTVDMFVNKNHEINMHMGSTTIETCLSQVELSELIRDLHADVNIMKLWDERLGTSQILLEGNNAVVVYAQYHFNNPLVSDRDFLFASKKFVDGQKRIHYVSTSVDLTGNKQNPNYVRGKILTNAWCVEEMPNFPNKFSFIYVIQADPCGKIIPTLVNAVSSDRVFLVKKFKQANCRKTSFC